MAIEQIPAVAEQPTVLGKFQVLWDYVVVKLTVLTAALATIGFGIPTIQSAFPNWHVLDWVPVPFIHVCQACAALTLLGIIPARGVAQPNLPAKQAARTLNQ